MLADGIDTHLSWCAIGHLMTCQVGRATSLQLRLLAVRCVLSFKRVWLHPLWLPPFSLSLLGNQSIGITHLLLQYSLWPLSIHPLTVASNSFFSWLEDERKHYSGRIREQERRCHQASNCKSAAHRLCDLDRTRCPNSRKEILVKQIPSQEATIPSLPVLGDLNLPILGLIFRYLTSSPWQLSSNPVPATRS